jgi:hypothetical protein
VHRYEKLRAAAMGTDLTACPGLGVLRRQGLAAWIQTLGPDSEATRCDHRPAGTAPQASPLVTSDVTRLIAGILVAIALEGVHA